MSSDGPVIGAVTIGQSPRPDVLDEMRPLLPPGVRIVEAGALDGLSADEVHTLRPGLQGAGGARAIPDDLDVVPAADDHPLVTRLRDGREVVVSRQRLLPLVQRAVERVEGEAHLVMMLCTGTFPRFRTTRLVLHPEHLLLYAVQAAAGGARVGVLTPSAAQIPHQERRWRAVASAVTVRAFSPYRGGDDLDTACAAFVAAGVELVALDCLGYTTALKREVRDRVGRPVLLARTVLARAAAELV